ncbi:MAG: hypothetical protein HOB79_02310 [Rhodospirillaceae bacterium]|jgi:hypothetical protein|nr:hypothetical protein [Rhodospirillaceae bacterium]
MTKANNSSGYYIKRSLSIRGWDLMKDGVVVSLFFSKSSAAKGCEILSQNSDIQIEAAF